MALETWTGATAELQENIIWLFSCFRPGHECGSDAQEYLCAWCFLWKDAVNSLECPQNQNSYPELPGET